MSIIDPAPYRRAVAYASAAGFGLGALKALLLQDLPPDARRIAEEAVAELEKQLEAIPTL